MDGARALFGREFVPYAEGEVREHGARLGSHHAFDADVRDREGRSGARQGKGREERGTELGEFCNRHDENSLR